MPFDARAAKLLQPGEHITLQEHPGLRLVATATRRSWVYRYKSPVDGGMRQVKIGQWPILDYIGAAGEWQRLRALRDAGTDPSLQKRAARREEREATEAEAIGPYTVRQLVLDYLENHIDVRRKPKGRAEVRRLLTQCTEKIADRPAAGLQRKEAFELLESMADRPVLAAQVRQEMGAAWSYGLDSGRLPESTQNWWRHIMRGRLRSKGKKIAGEHVGEQKRVLSDKEVGELVNWLPNFSKTIADALTLYLWTGTRGSEIVSMEKGEITEEPTGLWWTLPKAKTKNARHALATDLRVPLVGRAKAVVLRRREQAERFLFRGNGREEKPIEQKVVQGGVYHHQPYSKTKEKGQIPRPRLPVTHWSPHDLRRTARTLLASIGCPQDVAESVLGHMQPGIVGTYNRHGYDAERLEWLTKLDARLEQLAAESLARAAS
jgi:integrase